MRVLLAEKPSVARDLAHHVGASAKQDGYFEGRGWQVTWALGHLVALREPDELDARWKRWSLETLPIVPERFELKIISDPAARRQFGIVQRLLRRAEEIVGATDAGREGELILRYILEMAGCEDRPLRRLWLSSLTPQAIRQALKDMRPGEEYEPLYAAARCRSEADWLVGMNATRALTVRHGRRGLLWSAGRVQTPVLAMIVDRDDEIRLFRPEPFWELLTRFASVLFKHTGGRLPAEDEAQKLLEQSKASEFAVTKIEKKTENIPSPLLFDLTELQREMSRRYGMTAAQTLKAAQSLYEEKVITYPRTDSRYLTKDARGSVPEILRRLTPLREKEIGELDLDNLRFNSRIINDAKVADHHAIIPTGDAPGRLASPQQRIFDAVLTRLIAVFYPNCVKEATIIDGVVGKVPFRARGVRVVSPGWTELYPRRNESTDEDEQALPELRVGQKGPHEPFIRQGETTPPRPYSEHSLLGAMETAGRLVDDDELREALKERGLGTPATRAAIIETLLARGYIERDAKSLLATDLGRFLIALVRDPELRSPELTGAWEAKFRQIEKGRLEAGRFMREVVDYVGRLVAPEPPLNDQAWGQCPRCGKPVIEGSRGWGCSGWREGCGFVLWRDQQGHSLSPEQARQLLQRRLLFEQVTLTDEHGAERTKMLYLSSQGGVIEIDPPQAPVKGAGSGAGSGGKKRGAARSTKALGGKRTTKSSKGRKASPKTASSDKRTKKPRGRKASEAPAQEGVGDSSALGACPVCGSDVREQSKSFGCSAWRDGCKFAIWKTIAGKKITRRMAETLLRTGQTALLKGFTSKAGNSFDAVLRLDDGEVRFDFHGKE